MPDLIRHPVESAANIKIPGQARNDDRMDICNS